MARNTAQEDPEREKKKRNIRKCEFATGNNAVCSSTKQRVALFAFYSILYHVFPARLNPWTRTGLSETKKK